jgi:hypothetical protein
MMIVSGKTGTQPNRVTEERGLSMRYLLILLTLLSVAVQATPLTVTPDAKARSYVIETDSGWVPGTSPNTLMKHEEGDPEDFYPQTLSAFAVYEPDAGVMVANMKRFMPGKFQPIQLGELDALLERNTRGFTIHAGQDKTKITISYQDGRSSLDQASQDALLQAIASSFRWTR